MTEQALQQYLIKQYPKEDEGCEWKEFKNLKNDFSGHEKDDVISYVSALANMEGGHLVVGVDDKELKTEYIRNKSFNDLHFKDMIIQYLRLFGGATRAELNTLLQSKLSDVLTEEQKIRKIGNMLSALKKQGVIKLTEKKKWVLVEV